MYMQIQLVWLLLVGFIIVVPPIGAVFLWKASKLFRIDNATYLRCYIAYVSAYIVASIVVTPIAYFLADKHILPNVTLLFIFGVAIPIHLIIVPKMLRADVRRAILAHLVALLMFSIVLSFVAVPVVLAVSNQARAKALRIGALQDLRAIGNAMWDYCQENGGRFPSAAIFSTEGTPLLSWRVTLLPSLGYHHLYERFRLDEPWDSPHNRTLLQEMPQVYLSRTRAADQDYTTHYRVFVRDPDDADTFMSQDLNPLFGDWSPSMRGYSPSTARVRDGPSYTILVVEAFEPVPWTKPDPLLFSLTKPLPQLGGDFEGRFSALMVDVSAHLLPVSTPDECVRALITASGGDEEDALRAFDISPD